MELNTRVSKTKISQMMVGKLAKRRQQTFPFQRAWLKGMTSSREFGSPPCWLNALQAGGSLLPKCSTGERPVNTEINFLILKRAFQVLFSFNKQPINICYCYNCCNLTLQNNHRNYFFNLFINSI